MQNEFCKHFDVLLASLRAEEAEQKKRYDSALDIEDMSEATFVTIDARTKIQQLRKWIEDVQRISQEIKSVYPINHTVEQENLPIPQFEENNLIDEIVEPAIAQDSPVESVISDGSDGFHYESSHEFVLLGRNYSVDNCQEILVKLCEMMVLMKPYKFASLGVMPVTVAEQQIIDLDELKVPEPRTKLSNGLYITTGGAPNEIKLRCEQILKACGYRSDALKII